MPSLGNNVFDQGLVYLQANGTRLDICETQEPATYAEIATYTLGNKVGITIGAPQDRVGGGREVEVSAIADGSVTGDGTAAFFAISDGVGELLVTGTLTAPQVVSNGNTFTLTLFSVGIPDPA